MNNLNDKKLLTVQDFSCFGQCSTGVALPIISAMGIETCPLPTALFSAHTAFKGFIRENLEHLIIPITEHWKKLGIKFDTVYCGYLGSNEIVDLVLETVNGLLKNDGLLIVDPAMAENGVLYTGFKPDYAEKMKKLCKKADYILPNISEACLLCGADYKDSHDETFALSLIKKMRNEGFGNIVLTGVMFDNNETGVLIYEGEEIYSCRHKKIPENRFGTGDVFSSVFAGGMTTGLGVKKSAEKAALFVTKCLEATVGDNEHWYGVKFEKQIPYLSELMKE